MRKQKSKKGVQRRQTLGSPMRSLATHPPQINKVAITHRPTLRFVALGTAAVINVNITYQNLLDSMLVATSATAVSQLFEFVKIHRIRVWGASPSPTAAGNAPGIRAVGVEYAGVTSGAYGDQEIHMDQSMDIFPAFVDAVPSRKAQCSEWQASATIIAFKLLAPPGSIVDIEASFRSTWGSSNSAQTTGTGLSAGATYFRGLDGLAAASTTLYPGYNLAAA
jgi:hypothetical protein